MHSISSTQSFLTGARNTIPLIIATVVAFFVSIITRQQFLAIGVGLVSFLIINGCNFELVVLFKGFLIRIEGF